MHLVAGNTPPIRQVSTRPRFTPAGTDRTELGVSPPGGFPNPEAPGGARPDSVCKPVACMGPACQNCAGRFFQNTGARPRARVRTLAREFQSRKVCSDTVLEAGGSGVHPHLRIATLSGRHPSIPYIHPTHGIEHRMFVTHGWVGGAIKKTALDLKKLFV